MARTLAVRLMIFTCGEPIFILDAAARTPCVCCADCFAEETVFVMLLDRPFQAEDAFRFTFALDTEMVGVVAVVAAGW